MHGIKMLSLFVLLAFAGLNVFVVAEGGLTSLEALIKDANPWALLFAVDLVIALGMVTIALWKDARARGVSPFPYLFLTALTGSIGPLLYVVRRR